MTSFVPALIVVDFQHDFCPQSNGSLAVPDGLSIAKPVNQLLSLPFTLRLATRDWHPPDHISFKTNHKGSSPDVTIAHPDDPSRSYTTALWPPHCIQHSAGAALVPELDRSRLDAVFDKGLDARFEMYSAFYDPFRVCDSGMAAYLAERNVTHVYVVGLAADHCVVHTARHASELGFVTYIVDEATRPIDPDGWPDPSLNDSGVTVVSIHGQEVARVRVLSERCP
ncbi:nicotinamidase [Ophiocordyceps camponoti-floridani]|uniref:nicotinamidase n=1 Tax=Ophiocordyceps camponoti-floridani TaxID=2030778 RepID=A0A8H4VFQ7_9HYPO|nr:nicotinamidase [Ophiocordyceps camponoti-floridani]